MNCIIIEDQPPAQRILQKYINDFGSIELLATFTDALQAFDYLKTNSVDLIFLDIHLPKLSGIDFLDPKKVHQLNTTVSLCTLDAQFGEPIYIYVYILLQK